MLFGMNLAGALNPQNAAMQVQPPAMHAESQTQEIQMLDQQIDTVRKLKDLVDAGILSQEEFETKKHQVLNI